MLQKAIAKKIAYVAGDAFYPDGGNYNSMRLNFSFSDDNTIKEGVRRLADVIKEELYSKNYSGDFIKPEGI